MPHNKDKPLKQPISEQVSTLASSVKATGETEESYKLESLFVDEFSESVKAGDSVSLVELAQRLGYERDRHDFSVEVEKHGFRMSFLRWLFYLTCAWLLAVIVFVAWTALSPSIADREKLVQLQNQIGATNGATNVLQATMLHAVSPKYCPILFHLSDSVLVAFITSTTVAVLGLFLTAAKWLYGASIKRPIDSKSRKRE